MLSVYNIYANCLLLIFTIIIVRYRFLSIINVSTCGFLEMSITVDKCRLENKFHIQDIKNIAIL